MLQFLYFHCVHQKNHLLERLKNVLRSFYSIQIVASDIYHYCKQNAESCI